MLTSPSAAQVTKEVFQAAKGRLKVVGRAGVGVDNVDLNAATEVFISYPILILPEQLQRYDSDRLCLACQSDMQDDQGTTAKGLTLHPRPCIGSGQEQNSSYLQHQNALTKPESCQSEIDHCCKLLIAPMVLCSVAVWW